MYLCLLLYFDADAFENPPLIGYGNRPRGISYFSKTR